MGILCYSLTEEEVSDYSLSFAQISNKLGLSGENWILGLRIYIYIYALYLICIHMASV